VLIGEQLGAYAIRSELGSGGMGKVYLAEVVEAAVGLEPGREIALKVVHPHLMETPGFFKRFMQEAELGQRVRHENVVRTFDVDAIAHEGRQHHFMVMEYVKGKSLRELLNDLGTFPETLLREVALQTAAGLTAIHEAGIIHRDLKPENILITDDHEIRIMDLGVAKLQEATFAITKEGQFAGSLLYAAPEQFMKQAVGPSADLYSFGVLLYELATGQHPFLSDDASAVIQAHLTETPPLARERNEALSLIFSDVVATLMAKRPSDRFESAEALRGVLQEAEGSAWWGERATALQKRHGRLPKIRVSRETRLYGRDDDLARLNALFERAKAGEGQVLLIEGEAGIGKTRLVDEFVGRLQERGEDVNVLFGSYPPGGAATAAGAFSTAYREQFGDVGSVGYLPDSPALVPAFDALLRGGPPPRGEESLTKDSLQTVFVQATRALAAERPTIVLIDDLHFAPEGVRLLFTTLAMAVPGHRVLLVGTMRPGVDERWIANFALVEQASRVSLTRLGPKDLTLLLKDAFRSQRLAEELGFKIAEKSDGSPFFALEIIRSLREGGFIALDPDGAWVSTQVIKDIQIPSSVMDLISARLRDLSEAEKDLLDVASCCGFEFDPSLLAAVSGTPLIPALKSLARIEKAHRLIRSAGMEFVFDHHQVQESLYEGLPGMLRQEYHAAIAEVLETRGNAAGTDPKELDGALCVELCEHLLKGAQVEKTRRYLDAALEHLEAGYLNEQMIELADRALEVDGLLEGTPRLDVLLKKNARLGLLGRREAQHAVLSEARALAEAEGGPGSLEKVDQATGVFYWHTGRNEEALPYFERARALCADLGDRTDEASATNALAIVLHWLCRYEEARAQHERALAIYKETGDRPGTALVTGNLGLVLKDQGRNEEARAHYERALAINREIGNRAREATNMVNLGALFMEQGRHEEAREHYARALVISKEIGNRRGEARDRGAVGLCLKDQGKSADAQPHLERAIAIWREIGDLQGEAISTGNLGGLLLGLGLTEPSRTHHERALALAREVGDRRVQGYWLHALGSVSRQAGDLAGAHGFFEEALSLRREIGYPSGVASTLCSLGGLLLDQGRGEQAAPLLEEALPLAKEKGMPRTEVDVSCRLALLPNGDTSRALETFVAKQDQLGPAEQMSARFLLFRATKDEAHLAEAKRLLDFLVAHAPEKHRETTLDGVPLHRDIMKAWELAEQG